MRKLNPLVGLTVLLAVPLYVEFGAVAASDRSPAEFSSVQVAQGQPEEKPEATSEEKPQQPEEKPEATSEEKPEEKPQQPEDAEKPKPATQQAPLATSSRCRKVIQPRGLIVRQRPTPNSPVVGNVAYQQEVTLVQNFQGIRGPDGRSWVEITGPVKGFISNGYSDGWSNLVLCSGDTGSKPPEEPPEKPPEQPSANLCRRIDRRAAPRGVVVRAKPSRSSEQVGGIPTGEEVTLVKGYKLIPDPDKEPRNWIEITEPVAGFISANVLVMCSK